MQKKISIYRGKIRITRKRNSDIWHRLSQYTPLRCHNDQQRQQVFQPEKRYCTVVRAAQQIFQPPNVCLHRLLYDFLFAFLVFSFVLRFLAGCAQLNVARRCESKKIVFLGHRPPPTVSPLFHMIECLFNDKHSIFVLKIEICTRNGVRSQAPPKGAMIGQIKKKESY